MALWWLVESGNHSNTNKNILINNNNNLNQSTFSPLFITLAQLKRSLHNTIVYQNVYFPQQQESLPSKAHPCNCLHIVQFHSIFVLSLFRFHQFNWRILRLIDVRNFTSLERCFIAKTTLKQLAKKSFQLEGFESSLRARRSAAFKIGWFVAELSNHLRDSILCILLSDFSLF